MPPAFLSISVHLVKFTNLSFGYSPFHILILQLFYSHINSDFDAKFLNCVSVYSVHKDSERKMVHITFL